MNTRLHPALVYFPQGGEPVTGLQVASLQEYLLQ